MTDNNDEYDEFYDDVVGGEPPQSSPPTGYGKPPVANQFRKGTSGNRYGRPRKQDRSQNLGNFTAAMAAELSARQTVKKGGKVVKMSRAEIAASMLSQDLIHPDPKVRHRAFSIADRMNAFQNAQAFAQHLQERSESESSGGGWTPEMEERFQIIEAEFFENPVPRPKPDDKSSNIVK